MSEGKEEKKLGISRRNVLGAIASAPLAAKSALTGAAESAVDPSLLTNDDITTPEHFAQMEQIQDFGFNQKFYTFRNLLDVLEGPRLDEEERSLISKISNRINKNPQHRFAENQVSAVVNAIIDHLQPDIRSEVIRDFLANPPSEETLREMLFHPGFKPFYSGVDEDDKRKSVGELLGAKSNNPPDLAARIRELSTMTPEQLTAYVQKISGGANEILDGFESLVRKNKQISDAITLAENEIAKGFEREEDMMAKARKWVWPGGNIDIDGSVITYPDGKEVEPKYIKYLPPDKIVSGGEYRGKICPFDPKAPWPESASPFVKK